MNLVFLSTAFPQPGDAMRAPYNLRLCEALAERHTVRVISPVRWRMVGDGRRPFTDLPQVAYPAFVYPPGMLRATHGWWLWQSIRASVRALVAERSPDAVISYWTWPDGDGAARLARSCGAPSIMIVGGSDVLVLSAHPAHRRRIARTLGRAAAVVVVSERLRREVEALGVPPERIAVVRRGVDIDVFSPGPQPDARQHLGLAPADRVLLWVGRLSPVKGPDLLLDALERLVAADVGWRCVVVGDGPMRGGLVRRVNHSALRDRVSFVAAQEPAALAGWYRAADALVVSSRSEGMPNVVYEAKACGTPVVSTDVGDVAEVLDGNDRLVPCGDAVRLASAITEVLEAGRTRTASVFQTWAGSAAALTEVIARVRAESRGVAPHSLAPIADALHVSRPRPSTHSG